MKLFKKILVANRGEIAVRIMKSAKSLGIKTVAIYASADSDSLHLNFADESYNIGEVELAETYLNIEKIVNLAEQTGCDAVHPGYGFLAENPEFVRACDKKGITFIGPRTETMDLMGNKVKAREFIESINIPLVQGITGDSDSLLKEYNKIPFPILIKAAAGGGGKGMRIVYEDSEMKDALEATAREAKSYFGDGTIFIEKYVVDPRHIEFQVLGDNFGNIVHLFERECSIQRRYQKIIEEAPSPTVDAELREKMGAAAVRIGKEVSYNSAGTIEFLVDKDKNFYFLEMNTRIQVEHPVTEETTGVDLVTEQILVAAGNKLRLKQEDLKQTGHSIECRIYAEDPANNFLPAPGIMSLYVEPRGKDIRIDTGIDKDTEIKSFYDPMISKLIVFADDRELAMSKMKKALADYKIHGIATNISYLQKIMDFDQYRTNDISTNFCDSFTDKIIEDISIEKEKVNTSIPLISYFIYSLKQDHHLNSDSTRKSVWNTIGFWRGNIDLKFEILSEKKKDEDERGSTEYNLSVIVDNEKNSYDFIIDGSKTFNNVQLKSYDTETNKLEFYLDDSTLVTSTISEINSGYGIVEIDGNIFEVTRNDLLNESLSLKDIEDSASSASGNSVKSPMPGKVIKIYSEAMKMENSLKAPRDGIIESINVKEGDQVDGSTALIILEEE